MRLLLGRAPSTPAGLGVTPLLSPGVSPGMPHSSRASLVEGGMSPGLSPKGAAGGRDSDKGEFAPSRGLWEPVSEPDAPAVGTERDGISMHLGKKERKPPV